MTKKPYIPPKLPPPDIDYSGLIGYVGRANKALGKLNGLLVNIPNYRLLTRPLITKEAVLSSRIEGTHATLEEVFKYEAEGKESQKDEKERDVREIINYGKAISVAVDELKKRPIGENLIKKIHHVLLDSVRGENKDRGNLRKMQVYVGVPGVPMEEAAYIPPPHTKLSDLLSNWEKYMDSTSEKDPLIQIGVAHYQFEAIHPFMDGNGRIGRLLIPLFLYSREFIQYPLLYISEYFERQRKQYLDFLHGVDEKSDWNTWLKFFLIALESQALRTQETVFSILNLYDELKGKITTVNSVYAIHLLDVIFITPIVTSATIRRRLKGC
ncbi:MAG: Fic/DOC family N-terminal domain-containing protein, partial [Candidatus Omnitrophota bacterium]